MASLLALSTRNCRAAGAGVNLIGGAALTNGQQQHRPIFLSSELQGKRNPRKFWLGNFRGSAIFRKQQKEGKYDYAPYWEPVKPTGFEYNGQYHHVPEMTPEIIVPDLTDCQLKPYVSHRVPDIYQSEFTAKDLFDVVYAHKIKKDFQENKLDADGNPLEPSEQEKLTQEEAWIKARQTGCDIYSERIPRQWECLEKNLLEETPEYIKVASYDLEHPTERKKRLEREQQEAEQEKLEQQQRPQIPQLQQSTSAS